MEKEGYSRHAVEWLLATPVESLDEELEESSDSSEIWQTTCAVEIHLTEDASEEYFVN